MSLVIGLAFGPFALSGAKETDPPIEWGHLSFLFFGCAFAMLWVVGLQLIRKDPKHSRSAMNYFFPVSLFLFSSGVGAVITSFYRSEFTPASLLYLSIGAGLLIGILFTRLAFHARYKTSL